MKKITKKTIKKIINIYPQWRNKKEFQTQSFNKFNERPVEYAFVFRMIGKLYPKKILDVGTGRTALPQLMRHCGSLVTASDNISDYWQGGMLNQHYHVINDDITKTQIEDKFDLITCISVLEHIEEFNDAVKNMFSLLNPNGHLILTFPYTESGYVRNVYELPSSSYGQNQPYITQSYSRIELNSWCEMNNSSVIDQEFWQFWDGDYWTVGNQVIPPKRVRADELHQHSCILFKKDN